jgi:hypothetical protein
VVKGPPLAVAAFSSAGVVAAPGGTLTVTNSTFSGNSASASDGGGIYNYNGLTVVTNSTFSGNSACTLGGDCYGGAGGISNAGTATVTNTIIANSTSGPNCAGGVTDGGHNIDDGTTCGFTGTGCTTTTGTSFCNTNPVLDPAGLQNNGGPTQTIALCTGTGTPSAGCTGASPAINAGNESICSTMTGTAPVDNLDQRGAVRPGTGAANCSIGAFEANSAVPCVVGTGTGASCTEAPLNACLPGGGSFDGTVTFNCGGTATITVTSTKIISADTSIDGGSLITISGGNSVGVFLVNGGVNFTVQNLTIVNGNNSASNGGGIDNEGGTLTVTNSTFSGNGASGTDGQGGGIANAGTLTVTNSTFSGNGAYDGGGGIESYGTLNVTNSTFSDNYGGYGGGGGIENGGGTLNVTNSTFSGNNVYQGGGGIENGGGTLTVTNSTFSGNSASASDGGGIYNYNGLTVVTNSTFSGNSACTLGGDCYGGAGGISNAGTATVTNTIIANSTSGPNCAGGVTDGGHNIDDGTTCGFTGTGCTTTTGTSFCNTNPVLDPAGLQNNGGPTQTIALCTGTGTPSAGCTGASPAINAGNESICSTMTGTAPVDNLDQRGYVRPGAGATSCCIGAYEYNSPGPPCAGDCNGTGTVTVDEILTMVNIALGNTPVTGCEAGDANHDGQITVDEILTAVNNALNGCGGH